MRRIVLVFGLLIMSSVMFAGVEKNPNSTNNMTVLKQGNVVKVMYSGLEERNVMVTIYSSKRKVVFQEEVKGYSSFVRPYNLNDFPNGEYRIVMNDGINSYEEPMVIGAENVEILSSVVKSNKDKFLLTLYSPKETSIKILLRDDAKNILYSDRIKLKGGCTKLFNLKNISTAVSVDLISGDIQKSMPLK